MQARTVFFLNDTATTEIYTLSLHDALPISGGAPGGAGIRPDDDSAGGHRPQGERRAASGGMGCSGRRSEEHTSELQSRQYLVCRLLLEKQDKMSYALFSLTQDTRPSRR